MPKIIPYAREEVVLGDNEQHSWSVSMYLNGEQSFSMGSLC